MGQLSLEGSLTGGPPSVCEGSFPASTFLVNLGFADGKIKQFDAATGVLSRNLNSPSAFLPLSGAGPSDSVTAGNALYFKCNSGMQLQITTDDGLGNAVVSVVPVAGVLVLELPDAMFIRGLACKGTGPIEYLVAGPA